MKGLTELWLLHNFIQTLITMSQIHNITFPGETASYRSKRNELLKAEMELRAQTEKVAALRRTLPNGGELKEDYVFEEMHSDSGEPKAVKFSELFEDGKDSLLVYNFMFHPEHEKPCTSCNSILDGLNGQAPHIMNKINFVAVAKAPIGKFHDWAKSREWNNLRLLSSFNNSFNTDYYAESPEGNQWPLAHVFRKTEDGIYHFHSSELFFAPSEEGQNMRHVDTMWPLWNIFDLTPEGRGTDWYPKHSY